MTPIGTTRPLAPSARPLPAEGGTLAFMAAFFRAYPARSAGMVVLLILSGLAEGVGLIALLPLVQGVLSPRGAAPDGLLAQVLGAVGLAPTAGVVLLLITLMIALKAVLLWLAMREVGFTAAQVATDLRKRLIRGLTLAEWRHFSSQPSGHLTAAISDQASRSATGYSDACACLADLIQAIVYFGVVVYLSPPAALLALGGGVVMIFLFGPLIRMTRRAGADQTRLTKTVVARLTELLAGVKPIKAMGRESDVWPLLEHETEAFQSAQRRTIQAREAATAFHEPIAVALVALALWLALTYASLPLSELVVIAVIFYRSMTKASQVQGRYQTLVANESAFWSLAAHIRAAESAREQDAGGIAPPRLRTGIRLAGIARSFDGRPVLHSVDVTLPAGAMTAITGASGAGKTTLIDILIGLLQPDRGEVLIDGTPLSRLDRTAWRRTIGYVPQEVLLFHDTVRANVTLGRTDIGEDAIIAALKAADAWEFIRALPDGLDHVVGERGTRVSGGQRHRIAIARALVCRPQLLILDEATAALDRATEAGIIATLLSLRPEVTIVSISHQPAMTEAADMVLTVAEGRVTIAAGSTAPRVVHLG